MSDVTPAAPTDRRGHITSWRTKVLDDGTVGAWVTLDGVETWIGFFMDAERAQFSAENQILSAQAGWST